jgi:hypothetical protein
LLRGANVRKFFELFHAQAGIASNTAHRESIYWIVARDRHNTNPIRHDDVFTLAQYAKASLFQSPHGIEMIDAGILTWLDRHLHFTHILAFDKIIDSSEVFTNGILNICKRFGLGFALGPAARQPGTRNAETFV